MITTQTQNKVEEIIVPANLAVNTDKKTKAKSVVFPFQFPNGYNGVIIVLRLSPDAWKPQQDLEKITLKFQ